MKRNDIILIIVAVLLVAVVIKALDLNSDNKKLEIERKESVERVDSIRKKMELDSILYISTLEHYEKEIDSLKYRYYESIKKIVKAQGNIDAYLNSNDSVRFAEFKTYYPSGLSLSLWMRLLLASHKWTLYLFGY